MTATYRPIMADIDGDIEHYEFDEEEEVGKQMIIRIKLVVTVTINTV